jgi:ppGpp synthetase/RelA/SpoT-type nucleotidyltranferase
MFGQGWIGCDFDGTLAVAPSPYDPTAVGAPIPKMVERVKAWLAEGKDVRIFTARVAYVSPELLVKIEAAIQKFCFDNLGKVLPVTCIKDHDMLELWDDRARQVELNTGVLIRSIPDSSLTSGTDRAMEFLRVIKQYTEAFGDPDNWPVDSRENMFEMLRSSLREVVQKPFWSRLGIGYSNVSGQSFPEACALEAPHSLGPQGEPIYAEQGGVKRCVACICGGCEEHRYSDDQPRDEHGRFGSGGTSAEHLDKQAAARPTDEQRDLRAGYKEAFDAAREKFTEIAGKYGVISGRVKDLNSIAQKMATNPNYTGKPLSELKDVAGLRCTCPNVAAVRDCVAALREQSGLKIVGEQENKMDTPQGFYRAIHEAFDSMGENKFGERVGEIQVRTERQGQIAMWGHDCAYKGPYKKDEEVQAYARAVSNAAWELDNGRPASYPEKVPAALAERDLAFKPEKTYTDDWLFKERGDKYWEQTS